MSAHGCTSTHAAYGPPGTYGPFTPLGSVGVEVTARETPSDARTLRRVGLGAGVVCLVGVAAATAAARALGHPSGSPLTAPGDWEQAWWGGIVAAFAGYAVAVACFARVSGNARSALVLAVLIQATPLAAPMLLSGDIYAYQKYGASSDPYGAFGDDSDVYGPVWTGVMRVAHVLGGSQYLFRVLALCSVLATVLIVVRLTVRKALAVAFLGWNPLVAIHFSGAGKPDAFMMVFAVGAIAFARAGKADVASALWIVSVFVKWVTAPLYVLWAIDSHRRSRAIGLVGAVGATVAMLAFAYAQYGWTWLHAFYLLSLQSRQRSSFGMFSWLEDLGFGRHAAIAIGDMAWLAAFAVLAWQAWRRQLHLGLAAAVLLLFSPRFGASYLLWAIALAATDDDDRWGKALVIAMTGVLLSDAFTSALNA